MDNQTITPVSYLLNKSSINPAEIQRAIDTGVIAFILDAWVLYSIGHLKNKDLLDGMTAVGGMSLGKEIFEQVVLDFQEENKKQE